MIDYITFEGTRYPVRDVRLEEYEVDVKVSCESLESLILDDEGEYTSREAQLIDEIIFFYVPDDMIEDAGDESLETYITDNLEWGY
ncbi:MAG: hypothetical protein IJI11_05490 [Mogibacterium sp.]|nr:hypothetical protein [Mogibacterium sp.]